MKILKIAYMILTFSVLLSNGAFAYDFIPYGCNPDCGRESATNGEYRTSGGTTTIPLYWHRVDMTWNDAIGYHAELAVNGFRTEYGQSCERDEEEYMYYGPNPHGINRTICISDVTSKMSINITGTSNANDISPLEFSAAVAMQTADEGTRLWMHNFMPNGIKVNLTCDRWIADKDGSGNFIPGTEKRVTGDQTVDAIAVSAYAACSNGSDTEYFNGPLSSMSMFSNDFNQCIQTTCSSPECWTYRDESITEGTKNKHHGSKGLARIKIYISSAFNAGTCEISSLTFSYPSYESLPEEQRRPSQCENKERYNWEIMSDWSACFKNTCGQPGIQTRSVRCMDTSVSAFTDSERCDPTTKPETTKPCDSAVCQTYIWKSADIWSSCSAACGKSGSISETIKCYNVETGSVAPDSACQGSKPTNVRACTNTCPLTNWGWQETSGWSECVYSNGIYGKRTRSVSCVDAVTGRAYTPSASYPQNPCDPSKKPATQETCTGQLPALFQVCRGDDLALLNTSGGIIKIIPRSEWQIHCAQGPCRCGYDLRYSNIQSAITSQDWSSQHWRALSTWGIYLTNSERITCANDPNGSACSAIKSKHGISTMTRAGTITGFGPGEIHFKVWKN